MPDATETLAVEVRAAIEAAGMLQRDMARALGISEKHLSAMLTGRSTLTVRWAEAIAELCGRRVEIRLNAIDAPPADGEQTPTPASEERP